MIGSETPRYYEASGGAQYPSVTTVQSVLDKPALIPWAINQCIESTVNKLTPREKYGKTELRKLMVASKWSYKEVSERACDIGTTVHTLIENFLNTGEFGDMISMPNAEELLLCAEGFLHWVKVNNVEVIALEVAIEGIGYAGRLDAVVRLNGVVTLVDFKTSKGFYETFPMQLAAYTHAYNEDPSTVDKIERMGVLRLSKVDGSYEYRDFTDMFHKSLAEFVTLAIFWSIHRDSNYTTAARQVELLKRIIISQGGLANG